MREQQFYKILMVSDHAGAVHDLEKLLDAVPSRKFSVSRLCPSDISAGAKSEESFDVAVLDLGYCDAPERNIAGQLHQNYPALPLIILNDRNDVNYSLQALREGAQDYLVKSQIDADQFMHAMRFAMERMRHTEKLVSKEAYEPMTGLVNRLLLNDRLQQAINRAIRNQTGVAVLFISIDNFRHIDQNTGITRSTILLKQAANRIRQCLRKSDTVARVGSGEFVVLLEAMNHTHGAVSVSKKILQSLLPGFNIEGLCLKPGCSIGIALYPQCGQDIDDLIGKADITRCRAAREGGNRYCIYTEDVDKDFIHVMRLEDELTHALEREEFTLYYQPKYNLNNGRISGTEALLRWQHPRHGLLLPCDFMDYMEDKDIINRVGQWVLETACITNKRWHENGLCIGPIAVNIAGKQLLDKNFIQQVESVLEKTELPSCLLELEITENTLIDNVDDCSRQLEALRTIGVSIAIDDFGTGYSSFNYLRNFLIDTIKIDRSFIEYVGRPGPEAAITTAIIRLARDLHVNVVAEGVENLEQFRTLYEMAADEIQGDFLSPPMSSSSIRNYLLTNGMEMDLMMFETDLKMAV